MVGTGGHTCYIEPQLYSHLLSVFGFLFGGIDAEMLLRTTHTTHKAPPVSAQYPDAEPQ